MYYNVDTNYASLNIIILIARKPTLHVLQSFDKIIYKLIPSKLFWQYILGMQKVQYFDHNDD